MGRRFKEHLRLDDRDQGRPGPNPGPEYPPGTCRVQVVRSVSDWSHGVLKENSIQNACSSLLPTGLDWSTECWGFSRPSTDPRGEPLHLPRYAHIHDRPERRLTQVS